MHIIQKRFLYLSIVFVLLACNSEEQDIKSIKTLFTKINSEYSGIHFSNYVKNKKVINILNYRNFYNGGGVAIGDINNDGLDDIYFTSNQGSNKLYLNKGNFVFEDISKYANVEGLKNAWSTGVTMIDINNDGLLDIYVCNSAGLENTSKRNELFINNGNSTFSELAGIYGLSENHFSTQATFLDYDGDRDLDAFMLNNGYTPIGLLNFSNRRDIQDKKWNIASKLIGGGDAIMRNDNQRYIDYGIERGVYRSLIGFGMGVATADFNTDGYPDLYVSNDFYEHDYLYLNNTDNTFRETSKNYFFHTSKFSRGTDVADINNDGLLDIFTADRRPASDSRLKHVGIFESKALIKKQLQLGFNPQAHQNALQLNTGDNHFTDISFSAGVGATDWSWGGLLADFDNDGYKDLFVSNGIYYDVLDHDFTEFISDEKIQRIVTIGSEKQIESVIKKLKSTPISNYIFKNNGNLTFDDKSIEWGLDAPSFSSGAAYADLDNDGDLDLVINNVNGEAFLYRNNSETLTKNHYVKLKITNDSLNKSASGSLIKLYAQDEIITHNHVLNHGFQSSMGFMPTIGVGERQIDSLEIIWPDRTMQTIRNVTLDTIITLKYSKGYKLANFKQKKIVPLFDISDASITPHKEDENFDSDVIEYRSMAKEGPTVSSTDLNKDGLIDIFIGGAKGQAGAIYLQQKNGDWKENQVFKKYISYEDTSSAFFDADGDGDLDLIVGSGGNILDGKYATRLYINQGNSSFSKTSTIPNDNYNTSSITPVDIDSDGDLDVFIAMHSPLNEYGISPKHQILINDGKGNLEISTDKNLNSAFENLGMVTESCLEDVDGNGIKELIFIEDWGSPKIFEFQNNIWEMMNSNLSELKGRWQSMAIIDINSDGKKDFIFGNIGTNTPYNPTFENPLDILIGDFNDDGMINRIITKKNNGEYTPVFLKNTLTKQFDLINLSHIEYSKKNLSEIFSNKVIDSVITSIKRITTSYSYIAVNQGNETFEVKPLPQQAQWSSVNAIATLDINKDGYLDLILGGNDTSLFPQYGQLDTSHTTTFIGDNSGNFKFLENIKTGIYVKGNIKSIIPYKDANENTNLFFGINGKKSKIAKPHHSK